MRPRVGCLGLGWIGRMRLHALAAADIVDIVAVADPHETARAGALVIAPGALAVSSLDELLECDLDGVVIATPSAQHAAQATCCLERGASVFCQKPLARSQAEAAAVVAAAQAADRRLSVDMCYRTTAAARAVKQLVDRGALGQVYAAELIFHNAYGPDQEWYYKRPLAGGGCLMDLGVHLVDQLLWLLGWQDLRIADARLFRGGQPLGDLEDQVEDFAHVVIEGPEGAIARVTCSWRAPVGCDALIGIDLFGTAGGARIANVGGSFYDLLAERCDGMASTPLTSLPDEWGGRAIVSWASRIADSRAFDADAPRHYVAVSGILDEIYACARQGARSPSTSMLA